MRCSTMRRTITTNLFHGLPSGAPGVLFDEVAGVPVRADIEPPFGSYGQRPRHVGPVVPAFLDRLGDWIFQLQDLSGRRLDAVVACSVWRRHRAGSERPVSSHSRGRGLDIGGVWWSPDDGVTAAGYGQRRREAVSVEATLRLIFGTVLGPSANRQHADHWHVDDIRSPGITRTELQQSACGQRRVEVVYLQESCNVVHGQDVDVDGIWGAETDRAVARVVRGLRTSTGDIRDPETYLGFLVATALVGFGQIESVAVE